MIGRDDAGFLKETLDYGAAAVVEQFLETRIAFERGAAIAIDIEREELRIVAWREAIGGVDLAAIEHDIEGLRCRQPSQRYSGRSRCIFEFMIDIVAELDGICNKDPAGNKVGESLMGRVGRMLGLGSGA